MTDVEMGSESVPEPRSAPEAAPAVQDYSRAELRAQAAVLGLSQGGTKATIAARIDEHMAQVGRRAAKVDAGDYTIGAWSGLPNYQCNYCQYASLKKRNTVIHIAEVHNR